MIARDRHGKLMVWKRDSMLSNVRIRRRIAEREFRKWIEEFNEGMEETRIVMDCPAEYRHFFHVPHESLWERIVQHFRRLVTILFGDSPLRLGTEIDIDEYVALEVYGH